MIFLQKKLFFLLGALFILWFSLIIEKNQQQKYNNITNFIQSYGYPAQNHRVVTEDGYILTLNRIPFGKYNSNQTKIPVLLLHGLFSSAMDFVCLGPQKSIAFLLANDYDVWLGNFRGNTLSRKHLTLDPDQDPAFWNYSLDEIALFDVPAMVDYILNATSEKQLHIIGFSQGAIETFYALSENSKLAKKIRLFSVLGTTVIMDDNFCPACHFLDFFATSVQAMKYSTAKELASASSYFVNLLKTVPFLWRFLFLLQIYMLQASIGEFDYEHGKVIAANLPAGSSTFVLLHLQQMKLSGLAIKFDAGIELNNIYYGQEIPPTYNLSKVEVPVAYYYSEKDVFFTRKCYHELMKLLPNVVRNYKIISKNFNHLDFIYGCNNTLLYKAIMDEMLKY